MNLIDNIKLWLADYGQVEFKTLSESSFSLKVLLYDDFYRRWVADKISYYMIELGLHPILSLDRNIVYVEWSIRK